MSDWNEFDQNETRELSEKLMIKLHRAVEDGTSQEAIMYVIDSLHRGALGRRHGLMLSINHEKVWAGETALVRVGHSYDN